MTVTNENESANANTDAMDPRDSERAVLAEENWAAGAHVEKSAVSDEPVWSAIERELAADIAAGRLQPGSRLPGEHTLALRFRVNRHTVRHALGELAAKGVVQARAGLGTFVTDVAVDYVLGRRTRFSENLSASGLKGRHRLLAVDSAKATALVAQSLGLRTGAPLLRIIAIGEANERPITVGEHYFSARRFKGLDAAFARTGSISAALAEFGIEDFTRRRSAVSARLPGREVARHLGQDPRRPVLLVEGVNVDNAGQPIEFGRTWFAGDLVQLIVEPEKL